MNCLIKGFNTSPKCINCEGPHVASYRDCPNKITALLECFKNKTNGPSSEKSKEKNIDSQNQSNRIENKTQNNVQAKSYAAATGVQPQSQNTELTQVMFMLSQIMNRMNAVKIKVNIYDNALSGSTRSHSKMLNTKINRISIANNPQVNNQLNTLRNNNSDLRIVAWNTNGTIQHKAQVIQFLRDYNIDVMLISETRLTTELYFSVPNYKFYHALHPDNGVHAGAGVSIRSRIKHNICDKVATEVFQSVAVTIKLDRNDITIEWLLYTHHQNTILKRLTMHT